MFRLYTQIPERSLTGPLIGAKELIKEKALFRNFKISFLSKVYFQKEQKSEKEMFKNISTKDKQIFANNSIQYKDSRIKQIKQIKQFLRLFSTL